MNKIIIIPLGTVSPYCKNKMNCPGFRIKYKEYNILLDAGNGVTRYLDFPNVLNNLYIFISHMHKDHYGDLSSIEYSSYVYHNLGLLKNRINIYTPSYQNDDINYAVYHNINDNLIIKLDDLKIIFKDNKSHNIESYMIKLENDIFKIVYTSDIGNTNIEGVIEFSKDSDLLICESSLLEKSLSTHLTAYEAALIAREANVKKLMLTHFFPEVDKQEYLDEALNVFNNTIVAEENKELILRR